MAVEVRRGLPRVSQMVASYIHFPQFSVWRKNIFDLFFKKMVVLHAKAANCIQYLSHKFLHLSTNRMHREAERREDGEGRRGRGERNLITCSQTVITINNDSLDEWSKALAQGASPQGRGFEPHSCHFFSGGQQRGASRRTQHF